MANHKDYLFAIPVSILVNGSLLIGMRYAKAIHAASQALNGT
jgi:hypothetical protein